MLDFDRPVFDLQALAVAGIGVFEEPFRPENLMTPLRGLAGLRKLALLGRCLDISQRKLHPPASVNSDRAGPISGPSDSGQRDISWPPVSLGWGLIDQTAGFGRGRLPCRPATGVFHPWRTSRLRFVGLMVMVVFLKLGGGRRVQHNRAVRMHLQRRGRNHGGQVAPRWLWPRPPPSRRRWPATGSGAHPKWYQSPS